MAHLKAIFNSYSEIFFLRGVAPGVGLFLMTLLNPNVALAGLIAVLSAYLFATAIRMDREFLKSGFYTYNPLLVGLSIGYLFQVTPLTLFFLVSAGVLAFVLTTMLYSIFWYYLKLPILSLPFVIISSIAYLAASQYSNLYVTGQYPHLVDQTDLYVPYWIAGLLKSLGAILFMPDVISGAIFLTVILIASRILFMLVVGGYYTGVLITAALVGSIPQAFGDINSFNFILIAVALGGIFFIPSPKTYALALLAVSTSTLLLKSVEVFWSTYGIPAFTLPFNLISLSFVYVLGIVHYPLMTRFVRNTPEETLDHYLTTAQRYPGHWRTLSLPFSGKWTVWQGFDGRWTHQGGWRYAYDFVITGEDGETFRNEGAVLEDYHAWRKPVLSPVRGRVVTVVRHQEDMPIGQVDRTNNWGNLVIIQDPRDFHVELSHFAKDSIKVSEGDWVEPGTMLGLCGNSGYSPQPHIHIQVQATSAVGAYTLPFSFTSYGVGDRFHANHLPEEKAVVEPLFPDKRLEVALSFILDQELRFQALRHGTPEHTVELTVRMAPDGTFYFDSGKGQLYFGKHEGTFYFYRVDGDDPWLNAMLMALPRLPLSHRKGLEWEDVIPVSSAAGTLRRHMALFLGSFHHGLNRVQYRGRFTGPSVVEGEITSRFLKVRGRTRVELDEFSGFRRITVNDIELRTLPHDTDPQPA